MVLTLTFLSGVVQLALGAVKLGALVNFISHSVVVGFTAGAAILIGTSQIGGMLGVGAQGPLLHPHMAGVVHAHCGGKPLRNRHSRRELIPRVSSGFIRRSCRHACRYGSRERVVSVSQRGLPRRKARRAAAVQPAAAFIPELSLRSMRLIPGALAVAMLGLVEAVSIARSVATRSGQRIDNNQEFIGQGLSKSVGNFFSSYAASGSFTRTGVNTSAGAKTPMSAVFAALSLMAMLLFIAPLTAYLPIGAMAGILVLVAYNLIDVHHIKTIVRTSRREAVVMVVTFLSTLFVELEFAIYIGVLLSLMLYLNRTSQPHFVTLVPDPEAERRSFRNVEYHPRRNPQFKSCGWGSLFFGAVNHMAEKIARQARVPGAMPPACSRNRHKLHRLRGL